MYPVHGLAVLCICEAQVLKWSWICCLFNLYWLGRSHWLLCHSYMSFQGSHLEPTKELGDIIGVDFVACREFLEELGINSFGTAFLTVVTLFTVSYILCFRFLWYVLYTHIVQALQYSQHGKSIRSNVALCWYIVTGHCSLHALRPYFYGPTNLMFFAMSFYGFTYSMQVVF